MPKKIIFKLVFPLWAVPVQVSTWSPLSPVVGNGLCVVARSAPRAQQTRLLLQSSQPCPCQHVQLLGQLPKTSLILRSFVSDLYQKVLSQFCILYSSPSLFLPQYSTFSKYLPPFPFFFSFKKFIIRHDNHILSTTSRLEQDNVNTADSAFIFMTIQSQTIGQTGQTARARGQTSPCWGQMVRLGVWPARPPACVGAPGIRWGSLSALVLYRGSQVPVLGTW